MSACCSVPQRRDDTGVSLLRPLRTIMRSSHSPPSILTSQSRLNILLKEIGVQKDHIVIDPYTGALGYGFEYSYSAMERIRFSALKGDADLAMPMICAPSDSLTIKEVR